MLTLSQAFSVPQLFVADAHFGDAAALLATDPPALLARVSAAAAPSDTRLHRPTHAPAPEPAPQPRTDADVVPRGRAEGAPPVRVAHLMHALACEPSSPLAGGGGGGRRTASEAELSAFLGKHFADDAAAAEGRAAGRGAHRAVVGDSILEACVRLEIVTRGGGGAFSLTGQQGKKRVVNRWRRWLDREEEDPNVLAKALKRRVGAVLDGCRDGAGLVRYDKVGRDPALFEVLESLCELRLLDLSSKRFGGKENRRKAFLLNLYNLLVPVFFAVYGIAGSSLERLDYFDSLYVDVGGLLYSLNQIESGLLRGNRKAPYHLSAPFPSGSPSLAFVLRPDPRIHFALNCGSKSCPPVKVFSEASLEEELDLVAAAFVESADGVHVTASTATVSQIFKWYLVDFGGSEAALLTFLAKRVRKGSAKHKHLTGGTKLKVEYLAYDWSTDAAKHAEYKRDSCCCCVVS